MEVFLFEIFLTAYLYHLGLPAGPIKRFASFSPQIFDDSAHGLRRRQSRAQSDKDFSWKRKCPINLHSSTWIICVLKKSWVTLKGIIWSLWAMVLVVKPAFWQFLGWVNFSAHCNPTDPAELWSIATLGQKSSIYTN